MSRGLENIVGAVLLIAIVCSMALLIYITLTRYQSSLVSSLRHTFPMVNFAITAVKYYKSNGTMRVYVLNTGKVPVKIVYAEILNATSGELYDNCFRTLNLVIEPEKCESFEVICKTSFETGTYIVKVYSDSGQTRTYEVYIS